MIFCNKLALFALFSLLFVSSCSKEKDPDVSDNTPDRKVILTHWADNIVIPSYANFDAKFDAMVVASEAFTTNPTQTTLSDFRSAWQEAYIEWQKVELFEFGPADKYTIRSFFNIYPADVAGIEANIQNPDQPLTFPNTYAQQGFPALDYLLNGTGENDNAVVAYFTASVEGPARLAYITRLVSRMDQLITNVTTEWTTSYRETFISKTGLDIGSSMGSVVNAYVLEYERHVRSGKIGIPSGALISTGGVAHPEKIEAYYQGNISQILAKTAQQAAHDFFNGKNVNTGEDGPSLRSYLEDLNIKDATSGTALAEIINSQFETINGKLDLLSSDFVQQIETDNQKMIDAYTEMQELVLLLKVDMTSAMSITITYTDNDGD